MANTVIQLKYSDGTATPTSLQSGEAAYSNNSNKLFIGLSDTSVVAIGGKYYTDIIDAATASNTNYTLVKRDSLGMFSATAVKASLFGNANSATVLLNGRNFGLTGPDITSSNVGFDGSSAVTLQANLSSTGVTAGNYGGATQIPTFTVDAKGRLTAAGNVSLATPVTYINVAGDSGTANVNLASDTLTLTGGAGIDSFAYDANNTVVMSVDNTVIRTTGNQTITGNTTIQGNLYVNGTTVTVGVTNLDITDSIINLANGNFYSDTLDIGIAGSYNNGVNAHVGFFRDAETKEWYAFEGYVPDITANSINVSDATFATSNINASYFKGNIISRGVDVQTFAAAAYNKANTANVFTQSAYDKANAANVLAQASYSWANTVNVFTQSAYTHANDATTLAQAAFDKANTDVTSISVSTGDYGAASMVPVLHLEANGRISSISNTSIAIPASAITSGTLPIGRGGTNNTSFTANQLVNYDGTKLASIANSTYTLTGGLAAGNTITSLTVDGYGRVTAATGDLIAISTSQITSGTLGVVRGGTGASSFTVKGVIVSDTSSATGALSSLTSSTEGHILTINASGVPTFAYLSGGSF